MISPLLSILWNNPVCLTIAVVLGVLILELIRNYNSRNRPLQFPFDLDEQSIEIEPGVRASKFAADGKLVEYYYEDCRTMHEGFLRGMRVSNNGPCLGTRAPNSKTYNWISYREVYNRAQKFGSACLHLGLKPCDETFIGIYSPNCIEWVVAEEACSMFSMVVVPLYDTLGAEACEFIINQTEMQIVICDREDRADMLLSNSDRMKSLRILVVVQGSNLSQDLIERGKRQNVQICTFEDMYKIGGPNLKDPVPAKPETICTLCYTSGTTGTPKGVILSHKAIIANLAAYLVQYNGLITLSPNDVHLAYLPLAHMYERLNQWVMFQHGARIGFNCGDIRKLVEDMGILRPTAFPTVPRLLNRLYDKVVHDVSKSWIKKKLFDLALKRKMALLKRGIVTGDSIWDWLVFNKIRNILGGRITGSAVASAPISPSVLNFIRCAMGSYVFQIYGQTEVTAGIAMSFPHESSPEPVGPPLPCCHVKLVDIPEMEYYAKDGKGEVCVRSSAVMNGYYKEPEKTKEVIDDEGWVHTGDVGHWLPNGTLKLIDRKKHIFKLAQGEYVAPEKVESVYIRSPFIAQVFVDGDGLQTFPVAIVIPDVEYATRWAKKNLNANVTLEELCSSKEFKKAVLQDLVEKGKEGDLKGFEQVKDIHLSSELFTVENGLLTPSLKSKRPSVRKRYQQQISDLYKHYNNGAAAAK